jgi:hypothetical protein
MSEAVEATEDQFNISDIFSKRHSIAEKEVPVDEPEALPEKVGKETASQDDDEDDIDEKEDKEEPKEKKESSSKEPDYRKEVDRLNKTLKDTQRSFHEDRKKLSAYKRAVEKMKEEGLILDEEATALLDHTKFDADPESAKEKPVLMRYAEVWDKEIEYMRKYSSNADDINQSAKAFQYLIRSSSDSEVKDILDELSQYEDDEVELTKQMIEIGRQYNDDVYSEIHEAGGIRNLKSVFAKKEEELSNKLDRLQNKYDKLKRKYEDYDDSPTQGIPSGGGNSGSHTNSDATFDVGKIFANRYK